MVSKPRVGIIGGGAVGLTYAYFLSEAADVVLKTRTKGQADELNKKGFQVTRKGETFEIKTARATDKFAELKDCDAIIVAVKSYDTAAIAEELNKFTPETTQIVSLQNGLQAVEILKAKMANPERVFAGVTYIGARRTASRSIALGQFHRTVLDSGSTVLLEALQATQFGAEAEGNIKQAVWDKMVLNVAQNALSAVTNRSARQMLQSEQCLEIAGKLLDEFQKVAEAEGLSFTDSLLERVKTNWSGGDDFYPSMWQDLHNGRCTEIDAINGAIETLGQKHGIQTPYNSMITSLIKVLESKKN